MAVLCSPWDAFWSCSVPGALGFVVFKPLTLGVTLTLTLGSKRSLGICGICLTHI